MRLLFDVGNTVCQLVTLLRQHVAVDGDTGLFHIRQHRHQRHLDVSENFLQRRGCRQLWPHGGVQLPGNIGIFGGIGCRCLNGYFIEGQLFCTLAGDIRELDIGVPQILQCHRIHIVTGGRTA